MSIYKIFCDKHWNTFKTIYDTSLCNRLIYWAHAFKIIQKHKNRYELELLLGFNDDIYKLLELPQTTFIEGYPNIAFYKNVTLNEIERYLEQNDVPLCDIVLKSDNPRIHTIDDGVFDAINQIKIKNKDIEKLIETNDKFIGLHLRRGRGVKLEQVRKSKYMSEKNNQKMVDFIHSMPGNENYDFIEDEIIVETIQKLHQKNKEYQVYISSDLPLKCISHYQKLFPQCVFTANNVKKELKIIAYKTGLSFEEIRSFYDLFSLSNCKSIIGTYGSTFTDFANYYNTKYLNEGNKIFFNETSVDEIIEKISEMTESQKSYENNISNG